MEAKLPLKCWYLPTYQIMQYHVPSDHNLFNVNCINFVSVSALDVNYLNFSVGSIHSLVMEQFYRSLRVNFLSDTTRQ